MYRTIGQSLRQYKKPSYLTMLFMALEVSMEIFIPFLMAKILDKGLMTGDIQYVLKIGALMIVIACLSMLFGVLGGKYSSDAAVGFQPTCAKISTKIFKHLHLIISTNTPHLV